MATSSVLIRGTMGCALIFALLALAMAASILADWYLPSWTMGIIGGTAVVLAAVLGTLLMLRPRRAIYKAFIAIGVISTLAASWLLLRFTWDSVGLVTGLASLCSGVWVIIGGLLQLREGAGGTV